MVLESWKLINIYYFPSLTFSYHPCVNYSNLHFKPTSHQSDDDLTPFSCLYRLCDNSTDTLTLLCPTMRKMRKTNQLLITLDQIYNE